MKIKLRRDTRCEARDPRNCLDLTCYERHRFFPVPRDHAINDHRTPGFYPLESLQLKEIGDPIPGADIRHFTPQEYEQLERELLRQPRTETHMRLLDLVYEAREAEQGWAGDEAYVVDALDAPGYMSAPEALEIEDLTEAELLAGIKLGWLAHLQPWMADLQVEDDAGTSFLQKVVAASGSTS